MKYSLLVFISRPSSFQISPHLSASWREERKEIPPLAKELLIFDCCQGREVISFNGVLSHTLMHSKADSHTGPVNLKNIKLAMISMLSIGYIYGHRNKSLRISLIRCPFSKNSSRRLFCLFVLIHNICKHRFLPLLTVSCVGSILWNRS